MDIRGHDLSDGKGLNGEDVSGWTIAHCDISNVRFGRVVGTNFAGCFGSNVSFAGLDVTGVSFERVSPTVLQGLFGATWNGRIITRVSDWLTAADPYWCFATDVFVSIGCMQRTLEEWETLGESIETLQPLLKIQPLLDLELTLKWWRVNGDRIRTWVRSTP